MCDDLHFGVTLQMLFSKRSKDTRRVPEPSVPTPARPVSGKAPDAQSPAQLGLGYCIDVAAKFHRSVLLKGWYSHRSGRKPRIVEVQAHGNGIVAISWRYIPQMPHLGDQAGGFDIQLLLVDDAFPEDLVLVFQFEGLGAARISWPEVERRISEQRAAQGSLAEQFRSVLRASGARRMLDIGGRARSGVLVADRFQDLQVEVLDVLPGEGVTVVCDAHRMSGVLPAESFDAVMSNYVFEHLAMPWKVAVEMNRVMKPGAVAFIRTHQSVGMHDLPWDYFRFSDESWKAIFNRHTGFEIIEAALSRPNFIIPFLWSRRYVDAEKAAGFEFSDVLVRKIGNASVDWPLAADQVTESSYPPGETHQPDDLFM